MAFFHYADTPVASPAPNTSRRQAYTDHIMMAVIDFVGGPSPAAPSHQHPHEQISYVAEGRVNFYIGEGADRSVAALEAGDMVTIPPDVPHTVELLTESARLVDCFHPIREDFL
jgi:quercetin dioxygenase-like cupin family protein